MNQSRRRIMLFSGGLFLVVACYLVITRMSSEVRTEEKKKVIQQASPTPGKPTRPVASPDLSGGAASRATSKTEADSRPTDEVIKEIFHLSVQYSPESVPLIGAYLTNVDKQVRSAALEGLINLGESSAVPVIRKAAEQLQDPEEIVTFRKAADYLELPSDSEIK